MGELYLFKVSESVLRAGPLERKTVRSSGNYGTAALRTGFLDHFIDFLQPSSFLFALVRNPNSQTFDFTHFYQQSTMVLACGMEN